jgi:hypothetical protein
MHWRIILKNDLNKRNYEVLSWMKRLMAERNGGFYDDSDEHFGSITTKKLLNR